MLSTYYRVTHRTTVLCLRYDYVTDGEIEAQRIQLLSQGHKIIKPWDHGFGSRQSGFGSVPFTSKLYCPKQPPLVRSPLRTTLPWEPSICPSWPHSLRFRVDAPSKVDLKWDSFFRPKVMVNVSSHLDSAHVSSGQSGYGPAIFHSGRGEAERQDTSRAEQRQIHVVPETPKLSHLFLQEPEPHVLSQIIFQDILWNPLVSSCFLLFHCNNYKMMAVEIGKDIKRVLQTAFN